MSLGLINDKRASADAVAVMHRCEFTAGCKQQQVKTSELIALQSKPRGPKPDANKADSPC